ncbi:hypothetical protein [Nonomuraea guangzhouensis]|uniref:MFS transporter n=1 Tax=Nonomuraea guangzhouensis TaxID=1291555 RepID=A0ABW4GK48_9ACTN|nr:hypothetical protein [Nonomuraea guangzhouensis]
MTATQTGESPAFTSDRGGVQNFAFFTILAFTPFIATKLGEELGAPVPYAVGALCCLIGMAILYARRHHLSALARVDDIAVQEAATVG